MNFLLVVDCQTMLLHSGAPRDIAVSDVEPTSVRVSWQPAENAERYNVTLSKIQGQGRCPSDSHTVSSPNK